MKRALLVAAACAADACWGDPPQLPHPVRAMGWAIERGERLLRASDDSAQTQMRAGAMLCIAIVGASAFAGEAATRCGWPLQIAAAASTIALHDLLRESRSVANALERGEIAEARAKLSRIVGRDTATLDACEIARATIETLAESLCDGVIAPLVALTIGGVPVAFAYKAINTLDSMIGHMDERYRWFGRCAARADDVANYVPARMAAALLVMAGSLLEGSGVRAMRVWRRDGDGHTSPNAGQTEATMAGALGIRLGGANRYAGILVPGATFGSEFAAPHAPDIGRAMRMVTMAAVLGVVGALAIARWIDG